MTSGEVHTDSKLLMTVSAGILAMICAFVAFYRVERQPGLVAVITSGPAIFLMISLVVFLVVVFRIIRSYRLPETDHRAFNLTVALGIVTDAGDVPLRGRGCPVARDEHAGGTFCDGYGSPAA